MSVKYYDENAEQFYNNTVNLSMGESLEKFLRYLNREFHDEIEPKTSDKNLKNINILDLGCGSGRDSLVFIERGYFVTALDISEALAEKASELIGQKVLIADMRELDYEECFNGIWACASLLHIPYSELSSTFNCCYKALKKNGVFYASFKYGDDDYEKDGRNFTCFTETRFQNFLKPLVGFKILEIFITGDIRSNRDSERWLNVILRKIGSI